MGRAAKHGLALDCQRCAIVLPLSFTVSIRPVAETLNVP
jgi:hypothetical protein